ncbi:unnamed protein product [Clonostachys rosea]|uniref:Fungal-type protein kinase domain-containing protein n=1 Tax=Bionectria ochroleuca TaxID=29856 RepID=A0ABY6V3H7_BIOOC|nr:unnamed protein product [Clonostachys rosea]
MRSTQSFTDGEAYCFFVRSDRVDSVLSDKSGTINTHIENDDFQRFKHGLKERPGEDYEAIDILMKQVRYAQPADRAGKLSPVSVAMSNPDDNWVSRRRGLSSDGNNTLYLHECHKSSVFDIEFSRNNRSFFGYVQKHPYDCMWLGDRTCVGAVTMKGKLLLRENTPSTITPPHAKMAWCGWNMAIHDSINMASSKQEFERGIHTITRLRMASAEFWESVAASVGDPSTYDVAPDDWLPLQERFLSFPETDDFSLRQLPRSDSTETSIEPRIGDEEFQTFMESPWTAGSDSLRIFAKYAFDHQPPPPFTTNIPLTQLGLDPADPEYEPYNGYVPSNCCILVYDGGEVDCRFDKGELISSATDFTRKVIRSAEKKFPYYDNIVAFVVEVKNHRMTILVSSLCGTTRGAMDFYIDEFYTLNYSREEFEQGLRALDLVRKTAAGIQRRLCADVAARRTREIPVPARPDLMEVSRSGEEGTCKANDTMARIDLGAEVESRKSAPVNVETNAASQRGQKRGREEDEGETVRTTKHRRIIKAMPQARLDADTISDGLAAVDIKADGASQDGRKRRRDKEEDEAARTVTAEIRPEARLGADGLSRGLASMDIKADHASQNGRKRRQDEDEDEVCHPTEKYRRPGANALSRRKVEGEHAA